MKEKLQLLIIPGGNTFKSRKDFLNYLKTEKISLEKKKRWYMDFDNELGGKFDIIQLEMPLKENAHYDEWKAHFENYTPYLKDNITLIGSSLGGIFLAKYLSEAKFPKKILATHLIAPPFDNTIPGEDLVNGFKLKSNLSLLEKNSPNLYLHFSMDDKTVPIIHLEKYKKRLRHAKFLIYKSKQGHFKVKTFPELFKIIQRDKECLKY
jgi:predicted alpha/beta hydrolase family esterase